MITVVHYTDENLIAMLEAGDEEAIKRNPHLATCDTCRQSLDEYRAIVNVLGEQAAWDCQELKTPDPDPSTVATLRAFATSMHNEDEEAAAYVAALLEGPRETWMPRLRAHPEWRTAGVVRRLVGDAYAALTKLPLDGVEMTGLAIEIANHLVDATYPRDTVARLRGHAWREHAYGLFYIGDFKQSLAACDRADMELSRCVVDEYDRARVGVVRALSLRAFDRLPTASESAVQAAAVFRKHGDISRLVTAAVTAVQVQFKARDYISARHTLMSLKADAESRQDMALSALVSANLGYCLRELGDVEGALREYQRAAFIHESNGAATELVRVRWNVAGLLATSGRIAEAIDLLSAVRSEFHRFAMHSEYIVVGLEITELLLVQNHVDAAEAVCREVAACIERAGLSTTTRAITAVAYLQDVMKTRAATARHARHVRNYVEHLPEDPNLLFAPPSF